MVAENQTPSRETFYYSCYIFLILQVQKPEIWPERLTKYLFVGKTPEDDCKICHLKLKSGFKVMMMGSLEEQIAEVSAAPQGMPDVINDLDIEEEEVKIENQEVYLAKIEKRIKEYEVKILNESRPGKRLLVLDIDYTLFDHRSLRS